jgi:hypothetical protein
MKDLIIGCATNYDWSILKYWVNSINKCGFDGEKILVLLNCDSETLDKVRDAGFIAVGVNSDAYGNYYYCSNMPVHVERFRFIYDILNQKRYRFVITTDVKDVIFQRNPVEYLEACKDHPLVFSSESMKYKDEPWGNNNLMETFGPYVHELYKNNIIYNVGVLAGKDRYIKDLCMNILMMSINRQIPIVDQSTFNFIISSNVYKDYCLYTKSESGWACQLGTTADPSKYDQFKEHLLEPSPQFINGQVVTATNKTPYYIVHQYDRTPWRKEIEMIYGES